MIMQVLPYRLVLLQIVHQVLYGNLHVGHPLPERAYLPLLFRDRTVLLLHLRRETLYFHFMVLHFLSLSVYLLHLRVDV